MKIPRPVMLSIAAFTIASAARAQERNDLADRAAIARIERRIEALASEIAELAAADPTAVRVPYNFTRTQHILMRARVNGRGPYNFILDTGAPALFISTDVAREVGLQVENDWANVDRFEFEGGPVARGVRTRVDDPFQLIGMNAMGMPGQTLHGVIGYNLAARYRIAIDLTRRYMLWTALGFAPPEPPAGFSLSDIQDENAMRQAAASADSMEQLVRMAGSMVSALGGGRDRATLPRGYLGIEVEPLEGRLVVVAAHEGSPAAVAGLRAGDVVVEFGGRPTGELETLMEAAAQIVAGDRVEIAIDRGGGSFTFSFRAGAGYE